MSRQKRSYSQQPENTRQFILATDRLCVVMVGLPARGKSFMAKKIYKYLCHLQLDTKVFNFGSYRRIATKNTTVGKASASFFDPDNKEASRIREQCCLDALRDLISWYNTGGQIGILDATNTTLARRKLIRDFFNTQRSQLEYNVALLHVESICNDPNIIHNNIISVKLKNPDYCTVDAKQAVKDFKERIQMYKKVYHEVQKVEGSYIKVIDVGTEVQGYQIDNYISCRIFYFLMHLHLHSLTKTPRKPLLMQIKNFHKAKEDKAQEDRLKMLAEGVGATFVRPKYDRPVHALAPFMRRPSYLMWSSIEDTYDKEKKNLDEIAKEQQKKLAEEQQKQQQTQPAPRVPPRVIQNNIDTIGEEKSKNDFAFGFKPGQYPLINPGAGPIAIDASHTTPTPSPNLAGVTPHVPPALRAQHSVRKSTVLHRLIKSRVHLPNMKLFKQTSESVNDDGYNTDNEENSSESEDLTTDNEDAEEKFNCEICGRNVFKGDTHLVENRRDVNDEVRICEICLYETDSEDDGYDPNDHSQFYENVPQLGTPAVTSPQTAPAHFGGQYSFEHANKVSSMKMKTDEIAMSIGVLVNELNDNKNQKRTSKHVKQELMRLKKQMEQLMK